jgi:hypothetical protein
MWGEISNLAADFTRFLIFLYFHFCLCLLELWCQIWLIFLWNFRLWQDSQNIILLKKKIWMMYGSLTPKKPRFITSYMKSDGQGNEERAMSFTSVDWHQLYCKKHLNEHVYNENYFVHKFNMYNFQTYFILQVPLYLFNF